MMVSKLVTALLFTANEISAYSDGCANPTIGFDVIEGKISACPGKIDGGGSHGASAASLCGASYDVCESAMYAAQLGLTEQICHDPSIFTDENQFFATKETSAGYARCYSGQNQKYVPGQNDANDIWGCGHPGAESKLGVRRFPCKVGGQSVMGFMLGGGRGVEGYGDWKHRDTEGSTAHEATRMSLTNARSGGVLCCRKAAILEYAPQTVVSQKMINTGLAGNYFDVDLGNALAKKYASIKGKGECKELCMAGNAPRSQCLRVPIMLNSASTPDLTYELLLKQTSYNKFGRGWIMSADDGAFDRSILMDDSRFGGVALGVGKVYDASSAVGFLPLGEYVHLVAVWEGDKASLYLDGQLVQTTSIARPSQSNIRYICLDQNPGHDNHQWNGCFNQIRAYDFALSADDVKGFAKDAEERMARCFD